MHDNHANDAVAAMHAAASAAAGGHFELMEKLRVKYMKTARDAQLAEMLDQLLTAAVQREDLALAPSFTNRARGTGMAVYGPTGTGKSRALERYFNRHPILRGYQDPASNSPMISISSPSPCTIIQLARVVLRTSGYTLERDLPSHRLWEMVFDRMDGLRKFILHLDELQHVTHNVPEKEQQTLCDILKNAMYARRITLIISGVDTLVDFLQFDDQLFRRLTILPFEAMKPGDLPVLERMVGEYAVAAGLKVETRSEEALYARLSHASLTAFGYAVVITHLAIENALRVGSQVLNRHHYANAFASKTGFALDRNPFLADRYHLIDCSVIAKKPEIPPPPSLKTRGQS
jgi:hypothetical protein